MILVLLTTLLVASFWYTLCAGRLFSEGLRAQNRGHDFSAALAYRIAIDKYRYSPVATIARLALLKIPRSVQARVYGMPLGSEAGSVAFLRNLDPRKVDFFSLGCLFFSLLCALDGYDALGIRQRLLTHAQRRKGLLVAIVSLAAFVGWVGILLQLGAAAPFQSGRRQGDVPSEAFATVGSALWAAYSAVICVRAYASLFRGQARRGRVAQGAGRGEGPELESAKPARRSPWITALLLSSSAAVWVLLMAIVSDYARTAITRKPPPSTNDQVKQFLGDYFKEVTLRDVDGLSRFYSEAIDYYDEGRVDKDFVQRDKARYFRKWRSVKASLASTPVIDRDADGLGYTVTFDARFEVGSTAGRRELAVIARNTWKIRCFRDSFVIVGQKQKVLSQKHLE